MQVERAGADLKEDAGRAGRWMMMQVGIEKGVAGDATGRRRGCTIRLYSRGRGRVEEGGKGTGRNDGDVRCCDERAEEDGCETGVRLSGRVLRRDRRGQQWWQRPEGFR